MTLSRAQAARLAELHAKAQQAHAISRGAQTRTAADLDKRAQTAFTEYLESLVEDGK